MSNVSPAVQLGALLSEARDEGLVFDEAWAWAWPKVRWPHDTQHRLEWKAVLGDPVSAERVGMPRRSVDAQRRVWRACYTREPLGRKQAAAGGLLLAA